LVGGSTSRLKGNLWIWRSTQPLPNRPWIAGEEQLADQAKSLLTVCEGEVVVAVGGEVEVVVEGRTNKQGDVNQTDIGRQALDGIGSLDKDTIDRGPKKEIFSESETLQDEW